MIRNSAFKSGIAIALALSLPLAFSSAATTSVIPDNATPAFMPEVYRAMNDMGRKYARSPYINTYRELYGHDIELRRIFPTVPGSFMEKLNALPDAEAKQVSLQCIAEKCLGKQSGDGFMNAVALLESLRYDGLSEQELNSHLKFMTSFSPSENYQRWEDERMNKAVESLLRNFAFRANIAQWIAPSAINAHNMRAQYALHSKGLQMVSDGIRKAFDLEPAVIVLDNFAAISGGIGGGMTIPPELTEKLPGNPHLIVIDYSALMPNKEPWAFINTTAHETKHSIDQEFARQLIKGKMDRRDIRFDHTAAIVLNGHTVQNNTYALVQYTERNANRFGNIFAQKLHKNFYTNKATPTPP